MRPDAAFAAPALEYLENLADRLELLGLGDPDLDALRQRTRQLVELERGP